MQCRLCHSSLVFTNVSTKCADCHADIHRRQFGAQCEQCHTVKGWRVTLQTVQQHQNRFPLLGAHALQDCLACHKNAAVGQFQGLSTECLSCHRAAFERASMPDHKAARLPTTCETCHTMDGWPGAKFDHAQFTGFALSGAHARLDCVVCHAGGHYQGTLANCFSCHAKDFAATKNPDHTKAGFPQDCSRCHTMNTWLGAKFDHNTLTSFQLTGAHMNLACTQCHTNGRFAGTPKNCEGCHLADFQKTTNPNHVAAGFPQTCATCHTTATWLGAKFDHSLTRFPLTGAHASQACSSCHVGGKYTGLDPSCVSCHLNNYNNTTNPNHAAAGFPQTCTTCHTTATWLGAKFDHSQTKFPLTGAHVPLNCSSCHANGKYAGLDPNCVACHLTNFNNAANPNHKTAGFPTTCATCHATAAWIPAAFNHNLTQFPLTGAHTGVTCSSCHIGGKYTGTPKNCDACHLPLFQKTTNPNHVAAGFPHDCSICHATTQWLGAKFDHSRTQFPLTGAHVALNCSSCHAGGQYAGLNTSCVSCHLTNFNNTANPNHKTAGFPTTCATCHTTAAWIPASFNHNQTRFPLTGKHTSVVCSNCHIGGVYLGTPTDCYACHKKDFTSVTNPNHVAAGFPTTCATCHNTSGWLGARFNHIQFPIYTGKHAGKWTTCNDCHVSPSNYQVFSCLTCHEHNKTRMDAKHNGIRNYVYNSTNCYSCHPTGKAD
ncbi:MAG: hypothetical protein HY234_15420 [Acidobacteria bacterium]|nr:hypothetical protein [Acidobacteriota bacterium]